MYLADLGDGTVQFNPFDMFSGFEIICIKYSDDPEVKDTLAVGCHKCIEELGEIARDNTNVCDCGNMACLVTWVTKHFINNHVTPMVVTTRMEENL